MGNRESLVAAVIVSILRAFVAPRKLGFVLGADSMFRLVPEQVRLPDVAFISLNRWPDGIPPAAISSIAPDLAVEVLSESNTTREMDRKRAEYFKSGTRLVWIVDPQERTVLVYISVDEFIPRSADQMIDGGDVLPGFQILVGDFFADLDLKATPLTK
jgi:Uma2 family endonuclease